MNVTSSLTPAQAQDVGPLGSGARQDYAISVAKKAQDHVKQQGAAITQLIESTPVVPAPDNTVGTVLNVKA